ncbi:MAG: hypothetical protein Q8S13_06825, partial [Dehalococcoidia bacterium]|nr:hypothetical protein [Dehalococcoidia bacterium]
MTNEEKAQHLEAIAAMRGGILRPEDVVAVAADAAHPLHGEFTWDDAQAAVLRRLDEARSLIRSCKVIITTSTTRLLVPLFIHNPATPNDQGYVSLPKIRSDRDLAVEAIAAEG